MASLPTIGAKRPFSPRRTMARSNQPMLYPAAHGTACSASPFAPCNQHRSMPLSCFKCAMAGSTVWRRFSQQRCSSVRRLNLLRWMISTPWLAASTPRVQILQRRCRGLAGLPDLALHLAQHDAQDRALTFENLAQALELPGMGVAAGVAPQCPGFFGEGLLERDARALGRLGAMAWTSSSALFQSLRASGLERPIFGTAQYPCTGRCDFTAMTKPSPASNDTAEVPP